MAHDLNRFENTNVHKKCIAEKKTYSVSAGDKRSIEFSHAVSISNKIDTQQIKLIV